MEPREGQSFERQNCKALPSCPRNATYGPWGEWSSCTQTCYPENVAIPNVKRRREEAHLSSDDRLNYGITKCNPFEGIEYRDCNVEACPGILLPLFYDVLSPTSFKAIPFLQCLHNGTHGAPSLVAVRVVEVEALLKGPGTSHPEEMGLNVC